MRRANGSPIQACAAPASAAAGAALARISKFIDLTAESFYLQADLVILAIRDINKALFKHEKVVKEPQRIITIRNALITHPRKGRNTIVRAFRIADGGRGVRLSGLDADGSRIEDLGLETNVQALLDFVDLWIKRLESEFEYPWDRDARLPSRS